MALTFQTYSVITTLAIGLPLFIGGAPIFIDMRRFEKYRLAYRCVMRLHYYFPYLLLLSVVGVIMWTEAHIDARLTTFLGLDFTPAIYQIEGNAVELAQIHTRAPFWDSYFIFIYVETFQVIVYLSIALYLVLGNEWMVKMLIFGYIINCAVAFPFYIFFPVNEAWTTNGTYVTTYGYTNIVGVIHELPEAESIEKLLYSFNGLNNCLPSLHVSLTLTVGFIALLGRRWLFAIPANLIGFSTAISTVYLGMHWIIDVLAGIFLAIGAALVAYYLDVKILPPFRIKKLNFREKRIKWLTRLIPKRLLYLSEEKVKE